MRSMGATADMILQNCRQGETITVDLPDGDYLEAVKHSQRRYRVTAYLEGRQYQYWFSRKDLRGTICSRRNARIDR